MTGYGFCGPMTVDGAMGDKDPAVVGGAGQYLLLHIGSFLLAIMAHSLHSR